MNEGLLNVVLVLAAIFFVANTLMFVALAIAAMRISKQLKEMQPKLNQIAAKVEVVAEDVQKLSRTVQSTVEGFGSRAASAVGNVQGLASVASRQVEKFSPAMAIILTGLKVLSAFRDFRRRGKASK